MLIHNVPVFNKSEVVQTQSQRQTPCSTPIPYRPVKTCACCLCNAYFLLSFQMAQRTKGLRFPTTGRIFVFAARTERISQSVATKTLSRGTKRNLNVNLSSHLCLVTSVRASSCVTPCVLSWRNASIDRQFNFLLFRPTNAQHIY